MTGPDGRLVRLLPLRANSAVTDQDPAAGGRGDDPVIKDSGAAMGCST